MMFESGSSTDDAVCLRVWSLVQCDDVINLAKCCCLLVCVQTPSSQKIDRH